MSIKLFEDGPLKALKMDGKGKKKADIEEPWGYFMIGTGEVIIAFAHAYYDGEWVFITKYIKTQGNNWARKTIKGRGKNWRAQLFLDKGGKEATRYIYPVAKNGIVYVFSVCKNDVRRIDDDGYEDPAKLEEWDFKLSVGTITDGGNAAKKKIVWNTKDVSDLFLRDTEVRKMLQGRDPNDGFAFLMEDGTLVFVFFMSDSRSTGIYLIAYSTDPNSDLTIHMESPAESGEIIFPWGKSFVMVPDRGRIRDKEYNLRVSNDMGRTWWELTGPLAENLKKVKREKLAFTPITIGKRRVLLFVVLPEFGKRPENEDDSNSCDNSSEDDDDSCDDFSEEDDDSGLPDEYFYLYILDDEHFQKVGHFYCKHEYEIGGSLCYTNDELFFLHHGNCYFYNVYFIRLKKQLKKIKLLLGKWYPGDEEHATGPA